MDEIKSVLLEILEETRPDVDFEGEEALIDDKILGSFDIISIVSEINDEFDIKVKATLTLCRRISIRSTLCAS